MRDYLVTFITTMCLLGIGPLAMAFDNQKFSENPIQHKGDAQESLEEMIRRGQDKVNQAKGDATKPSHGEVIQTRKKESTQNKIEAMKEEVIGK